MSFDKNMNLFNQHNQATEHCYRPKFPYALLQSVMSLPLSLGNR